MRNYRNIRFWTGVIALYLIVFLGVIASTYYGTRLQLGTLVSHNALTQAR
jgi:hypothetical protein